MSISKQRLNSLIKKVRKMGLSDRFFILWDYDDGSVGCNKVRYKDYEEFKEKNKTTETDKIIRVSWIIAKKYNIE